MNKRFFLLLTVLALILPKADFAQQTDTLRWTVKAAKQWVKTKKGANGLRIKPHSSVDPVEFARQYHANTAWWDKAFAFLNDKKLDTLKPGKYTIAGTDVYATITEAPSKEFAQSAWESHRNYIDLQYVIRGKEKIGIAPLSSATVIKTYDQTKDIANYDARGKFYIATPEVFFLFFPGDAHRPNIKVERYDTVKKLVVKIRYTPLQ